MQYRQMVKRMQGYSGFSDRESEEALRLFLESLSARLNQGEREDLASQLPRELQDLVLSVGPTIRMSTADLYDDLTELQDISRSHARKQVKAAWLTLKDSLSEGEVEHVEAQLPADWAEELP